MTTATGIPGVLAATKPWVRLMSVLGFISAGFMILAGLGMMLAGMATSDLGSGQALAIGLLYPVFGLLYIVPSAYLFRYASRIGDYLRGGQEIQLELALDSQRSFWKFVGILTVIGMVVAVLGMAAAILIPAMLMLRG